MIDVGFFGPRFTWHHGTTAENRQSARLDRSLCNEEWRRSFPDGHVLHCAHGYSDHCPLLLSTMNTRVERLGDRPFRFQAAWFTHGEFKQFVQSNRPQDGSLLQQLTKFTQSLQQWNKEVFGNINQRMNKLRARLAGVQRCLSQRTTAAILKLESRLKKKWEEVLTQEELVWFQKYRTDWLQVGDRNTRFFHLSTLIRRRRNRIKALQDSAGVWIEDQVMLKDMVLSYYRDLYIADTQSGGNFIKSSFPRLTTILARNLGSRYTEDEVYTALRSMAPFKAPGPDGFHAAFYQ